MKYAVVRNGLFTGTLYETASDNAVAHHARFGESLEPVFELKNVGTEDEPSWEKVVPDLESAYKMALSRLNAAHASILSEARDRYAPSEREGWGELAQDAIAGEGSCLQAYANETGLSISEAADRVLVAREKYRNVYGEATGMLTLLRDQADAFYDAGNVEGLQALQFVDNRPVEDDEVE